MGFRLEAAEVPAKLRPPDRPPQRLEVISAPDRLPAALDLLEMTLLHGSTSQPPDVARHRHLPNQGLVGGEKLLDPTSVDGRRRPPVQEDVQALDLLAGRTGEDRLSQLPLGAVGYASSRHLEEEDGGEAREDRDLPA
jgi:hypothetical protein